MHKIRKIIGICPETAPLRSIDFDIEAQPCSVAHMHPTMLDTALGYEWYFRNKVTQSA